METTKRRVRLNPTFDPLIAGMSTAGRRQASELPEPAQAVATATPVVDRAELSALAIFLEMAAPQALSHLKRVMNDTRTPGSAITDPVNRASAEWSSCPDGIGKRADSHWAQITKLTTGRLSRVNVEVRTSYEHVEIGVLVVSWSQIWGHRVGYGFAPYQRYITSGGDVGTTWVGLQSERERVIHDAQATLAEHGWTCQPPETPRCEASRGIEEYFPENIWEVFSALQPFIVGWYDDQPHRMVWSDGEAAVKTVIAAMNAHTDLDPLGKFGGDFATMPDARPEREERATQEAVAVASSFLDLVIREEDASAVGWAFSRIQMHFDDGEDRGLEPPSSFTVEELLPYLSDRGVREIVLHAIVQHDFARA